MFSFILLLETGESGYWPKREIGLHFLSHLYCVPFTSLVWERKRKMVLYGINAWFQSKYFSSHIYLFFMSSKCREYFSKQISLVTQQLSSTSFLLTLFVLIYYLDADIASDRQSFLYLIGFVAFEVSGERILSMYLRVDACHSDILNLNNLKILFKCFSYCVEINIFLCRQAWGGQSVSHVNCLL